MTVTNLEEQQVVPSPLPSGAIKVYLTDDDPEFAKVVADLLRRQPGIDLVRAGESVETTLADLAGTQVDVLVLDLYMREGESLEAIPDIKQLCPGIKVLVITGGGWEDQQVASIVAGANGFLYKPFTSSDLARAIRVVSEGKVFFDAAALAEALNPPPVPQRLNPDVLSKEDREFLDLIRQGLPNTAIAALLNTGIKAVYQRRYRLKSKLGLRSARDLIGFAATQSSSSSTQ